MTYLLGESLQNHVIQTHGVAVTYLLGEFLRITGFRHRVAMTY